MRYIILLFIITFIFIFSQCSTEKKVQYSISPDVSVQNRKIAMERAEKGRILFKIHCAECHGIYARGKKDIPNFTTQQIDNYHARAILALQTHSAIRNLSSEQLDHVLIFLRLRKIEK